MLLSGTVRNAITRSHILIAIPPIGASPGTENGALRPCASS